MIPAYEDIDNPKLLRQLPKDKLEDYSLWLRNYLIGEIAEYGGHFAANLGVVELTVALHYCFNTPEDILIWDVGHQAYAHKILSGRKSLFHTLRQSSGISGFPKMKESRFDAFGTGHSSTSISAALGYAVSARLNGISRQHIAVIGDGAMSAGQAFEALNNAGITDCNLTVIINDNHIGIDPSQGAFGEYLEQLEFKKDNIFNDFGFRYFGPVDGHKISELMAVFEVARDINAPKIIHVRTVKGKGYGPAETEQTKWHSTSQFDKLSGKNTATEDKNVKYQDIFGRTLLEIAESDPDIIAVTPAMISGSSLHYMQEKFPERVFDVGIAEQHAVTFSAGLAADGKTVFCCIYSTFLQRAYDQLIHDVALQNLPVIFAVDRAGLVGEDGPTHHGVFDIAFLQTIPNICIISPSSQKELRNAVYFASRFKKGPVVIRYPRGKAGEEFDAKPFEPIEFGSSVCIRKADSDVVLISVGTILDKCSLAIAGTRISHYDMRFVKPLDTELLGVIFESAKHIFIVEEAQETGGAASAVMMLASELNFKGKIHAIGIKDHFVQHGKMSELYEAENLSADKIRQKILQCLSE